MIETTRRLPQIIIQQEGIGGQILIVLVQDLPHLSNHLQPQ